MAVEQHLGFDGHAAAGLSSHGYLKFKGRLHGRRRTKAHGQFAGDDSRIGRRCRSKPANCLVEETSDDSSVHQSWRSRKCWGDGYGSSCGGDGRLGVDSHRETR